MDVLAGCAVKRVCRALSDDGHRNASTIVMAQGVDPLSRGLDHARTALSGAYNDAPVISSGSAASLGFDYAENASATAGTCTIYDGLDDISSPALPAPQPAAAAPVGSSPGGDLQLMSGDWVRPRFVPSRSTAAAEVFNEVGSDDVVSYFGGFSLAGPLAFGDTLSASPDDLLLGLSRQTASSCFGLPETSPYLTDANAVKHGLQDLTPQISDIQQHHLSSAPWSPVHLSFGEQAYISSSASGPYVSPAGHHLIQQTVEPSFQASHILGHEICPPLHATEVLQGGHPHYDPALSSAFGSSDTVTFGSSDAVTFNPRDYQNNFVPPSTPFSRYQRQRSTEPWSVVSLEMPVDPNPAMIHSLSSTGLERKELSLEAPQVVLDLSHSPGAPTLPLESTSLPGTPDNTPRDAASMQWENSTPASAPFKRAATKKSLENRQKVGRRRGPLDPYSAKKASEMRKLKACWPCWKVKATCSREDVCDRCRNRKFQLGPTICSRAFLHSYTELFCPQLLADRHSEHAVQSLIKDNISGFTDNEMEVSVFLRPDYPPIRLTAHEFIPSNQDFLVLPHVKPGLGTETSKLELCFGPPLGIRNSQSDVLRDKCWDHIKSVVKSGCSESEKNSRFTSLLVWECYAAVDRFRKSGQRSGNTQLLRKTMMLYAINYFLSRFPVFTSETVTEVKSRLRSPPQFNYQPNKPAKLLNIQIKFEMYRLFREITHEVLDGLERELRTRAKASWATSFSVILILSTCVEAVQVAADGVIVHRLLSNKEHTNVSGNVSGEKNPSRDETIEISRSLDDLAFAHCRNLFHAIHRTNKPKNGQRNEKGFNPIRDGLELDEGEGLDQATLELVDEIRSIITKHKDELEHLSRNPALNQLPDLLSDHMRFRAENSGRLLAKFLMTFSAGP